VLLVPSTQVSPWQHPAQWPQPVDTAHIPPPPETTHVSPAPLHAAHACPPWPHAVADVPTTHMPLELQQPAHVDGLHAVICAVHVRSVGSQARRPWLSQS
jgi:hypothetical protein